MSNLVSRQHIKDLRRILLEIRNFAAKGERQKAEQRGYDHMALTGKGHVYLETHDDGIELEAAAATRLVHTHFRDLTYNHLTGQVDTQTVLDRLDGQIRKYEAFLADHDPVVEEIRELYPTLPPHDAIILEIVQILRAAGKQELVDRWRLAVKALDDARQNPVEIAYVLWMGDYPIAVGSTVETCQLYLVDVYVKSHPQFDMSEAFEWEEIGKPISSTLFWRTYIQRSDRELPTIFQIRSYTWADGIIGL